MRYILGVLTENGERFVGLSTYDAGTKESTLVKKLDFLEVEKATIAVDEVGHLVIEMAGKRPNKKRTHK